MNGRALTIVAPFGEAPKTSPSLTAVVERLCRAGPRLTGGDLASIPALLKSEARRAAMSYARLLAVPITRELLSDWLLPLTLAVRFPPKQGEEYQGRLSALLDASGDLPAAAFTADLMQDLMRSQKTWPSVAEIDEVVRARARVLMGRYGLLRDIASANAAEPEPAPATQAERDAVSAKFRALADEMKGRTGRASGAGRTFAPSPRPEPPFVRPTPDAVRASLRSRAASMEARAAAGGTDAAWARQQAAFFRERLAEMEGPAGPREVGNGNLEIRENAQTPSVS